MATKTNTPSNTTETPVKRISQEMAARLMLRILVKVAQNRKTITYEEMAMQLPGFPTKGSQLGNELAPVMFKVLYWCRRRNMPPLTSLIVRKSGADQGLPGQGFWDTLDIGEDTERSLKQWLLRIMHKQVYEFFTLDDLI